MKTSHFGVLAFLGFSLTWMGLAAHWLTRKPAVPPAASHPETRANDEQASAQETPALADRTEVQRVSDVPNSARYVEVLVRRLADLLGGARADDDQLGRTE